MGRFILIFTLFVFLANAANSSALVNCCEKTQKQQEQSYAQESPPEIIPCHHSEDGHADKTKAVGGCLCTYMCTSQIFMPLQDMFTAQNIVILSLIHGANDIGVSVITTPESPPPKA